MCFYFLLLSVKIMRPTIDVNLVEGRFFQIQLHCGFDQVRMFLWSNFLCIQNSLILHVILVSIVGAKIVNLVTSIRQPIYGPHPLIGRSSTSSTGFYFSPIRRSPSLPFWMKPEEILFFQYSVGRRMCSSS